MFENIVVYIVIDTKSLLSENTKSLLQVILIAHVKYDLSGKLVFVDWRKRTKYNILSGIFSRK